MAQSGPNPPGGHPSDHLANERTFLAWNRTSISIVVFGFVVAKFGITIRKLLQFEHSLQAQAGVEQGSGLSLGLGVTFMIFGIVLALLAWVRYHNTRRRLESGEFRPAGGIIVLVTTVTALFGAVLAVYLIFTSRHI